MGEGAAKVDTGPVAAESVGRRNSKKQSEEERRERPGAGHMGRPHRFCRERTITFNDEDDPEKLQSTM